MSLIVAWLLFPVVLAVLALGCGLALERATGAALPGTLVIPAGLAVIVVTAQLATATDATAELAAPIVLALAAAGLAMSPPWQGRDRFDVPALAAAAGVFAVFAAPVVLSGQATFAGYIKLDDTATFLALTDRVMDHGRSLAGLAPSSYEATLGINLGAYPVGSFLPLGIGAKLLGEDPAWLYQPWLAFLAAALALSCNSLLSPIVGGARLRALCTFVAAQPALLFGYALWGGIKELATAWVVALVAALVPAAVRTTGWRGVLPLAVAGAATAGIVSLAGAIWIAPALAAAILLAVHAHGRRPALRSAGWLAAFSVVLALPSIVIASGFLAEFIGGSALLTNEVDIGNLFGPINVLQVSGVWPAGDLRVTPEEIDATHALIAVVVIAAAVGLAAAVARRAWALALYVGATTAVGLAIAAVAGPWVAAKALVIASPAVLVAACAGAAHVWLRGRRVEAALVGAAIAVGVLWSNALAYREATLAPRDQLAELERIGHLAAGQGPTLMTEYNPYGARHFLREADGESVSELRRRPIPLRTGEQAAKGASADTDDLQLGGVLEYRTLVLRRSPVASRPPAPYRLVWRGRTYEMWQRPAVFESPREHLALGGPLSPAARPQCDDVRRVGALAGPAGVLASVQRRRLAVVELGRLPQPAGWDADSRSPIQTYPNSSGRLVATVVISRTGGYRVWLGGSVHGRLTLSIDGHRVGGARGVLDQAGAYLPLGTRRLSAGSHRVTIAYDDGGLRPGVAAQNVLALPIGPLVLSPTADSRKVNYVPASDWHSLCGGSLDWVEALPGS